MAPTSYLVVAVLVMIVSKISCVPANTKKIPSDHSLPVILSGDQSLPVSLTLPADAMPVDVMPVDVMPVDAMPAGMNKPGPQAVPTIINDVYSVAGKPPIQPGMAQTILTSEQGHNPVTKNSINYMEASGMTKMEQMSVQTAFRSSGQVGNSREIGPSAITPPMSMYAGQVSPSVPANVALMNIQMACQSLKSFVLSTPIAREIMTSVANMNSMAEVSRAASQCGIPALSTSLRMFLKTCNMLTSCPNTAYVPFPTFYQPVPPSVPYMVQPPNKMPRGTPVKNPSVKNTLPTQSPKFQRTATPMVRMFRNFMYGFRPNNIPSLAGQISAQRNTTQVPSSAHDD